MNSHRSLSFKVDDSGLIQLLRRDIYGRDDVFIRELIQNAADSLADDIQLYLFESPNVRGSVWCIGCSDNGKGMTKVDLQDQLLNLCHRPEVDTPPRFGRFGIGIFTYLAFSKRVNILTKAPAGKTWRLSLEAPEQILSLKDI